MLRSEENMLSSGIYQAAWRTAFCIMTDILNCELFDEAVYLFLLVRRVVYLMQCSEARLTVANIKISPSTSSSSALHHQHCHPKVEHQALGEAKQELVSK